MTTNQGTGRPVESVENLTIIVTMHKQGKTPKEIHAMLKPSAVGHSVGSVIRRTKNIEYILGGDKDPKLRANSQYRDELYDIVSQMYPGQVKSKSELPRYRTAKSTRSS